MKRALSFDFEENSPLIKVPKLDYFPLLSLPNEIITNILYMTPPREIPVSVARINKLLNEIVTRTLFWKKVCLLRWPNIADEKEQLVPMTEGHALNYFSVEILGKGRNSESIHKDWKKYFMMRDDYDIILKSAEVKPELKETRDYSLSIDSLSEFCLNMFQLFIVIRGQFIFSKFFTLCCDIIELLIKDQISFFPDYNEIVTLVQILIESIFFFGEQPYITTQTAINLNKKQVIRFSQICEIVTIDHNYTSLSNFISGVLKRVLIEPFYEPLMSVEVLKEYFKIILNITLKFDGGINSYNDDDGIVYEFGYLTSTRAIAKEAYIELIEEYKHTTDINEKFCCMLILASLTHYADEDEAHGKEVVEYVLEKCRDLCIKFSTGIHQTIMPWYVLFSLDHVASRYPIGIKKYYNDLLPLLLNNELMVKFDSTVLKTISYILNPEAVHAYYKPILDRICVLLESNKFNREEVFINLDMMVTNCPKDVEKEYERLLKTFTEILNEAVDNDTISRSLNFMAAIIKKEDSNIVFSKIVELTKNLQNQNMDILILDPLICALQRLYLSFPDFIIENMDLFMSQAIKVAILDKQEINAICANAGVNEEIVNQVISSCFDLIEDLLKKKPSSGYSLAIMKGITNLEETAPKIDLGYGAYTQAMKILSEGDDIHKEELRSFFDKLLPYSLTILSEENAPSFFSFLLHSFEFFKLTDAQIDLIFDSYTVLASAFLFKGEDSLPITQYHIVNIMHQAIKTNLDKILKAEETLIKNMIMTLINDYQKMNEIKATVLMYLVDALIDFSGDYIWPYYNELIHIMRSKCNGDSLIFSHSCTYGLGSIICNSPIDFAEQHTQQNISLLMNIANTTKCRYHKDNAIGSIGRILKSNKTEFLPEVFDFWFNNLPLEDDDENMESLSILANMVLTQWNGHFTLEAEHHTNEILRAKKQFEAGLVTVENVEFSVQVSLDEVKTIVKKALEKTKEVYKDNTEQKSEI